MGARTAAHDRLRWSRSIRRMAFVAALLAAVPAAAAPAPQQPDSTRPARADTAAAPSSGAVPLGPRRDTRWQPFRPDLTPAPSAAGALQEGEMHTIRISTLAIVLIGVIVLLLILH